MKARALTVLGWVFVILGLIGVILPLMPTTPFLLVALMCFSRGSPRFYHWLYQHHILGEPLRIWHKERRIPKRAWIMIALMLLFSLMVILIWETSAT